MTVKERLAQIVRVISIPPVQVCVLLLILYFAGDNVFSGVAQLLISLLLLMVIPILAYPLAAVIPIYKAKGREGQRKLAFILTLLGYGTAAVYGLLAVVRLRLMLAYLTYFISAMVLTGFNKLVGLRASGHACSIAGPLILIIYFVGWRWLLLCTALFAVVIWSSLVLKRHTPPELFWGSLSAGIAFALGLVLV